MPKNFKEIEQEEDESMMVVKQIYYIEKHIHEGIGLFPDQHTLFVQYEDLLNDPGLTLNKIKDFIPARNKAKLDAFSGLNRTTKKPDKELLLKLNECITQFNWEEYNE